MLEHRNFFTFIITPKRGIGATLGGDPNTVWVTEVSEPSLPTLTQLQIPSTINMLSETTDTVRCICN
jgi:hypothetical protein